MKIFTLNDAREERLIDEMNREHKIAVREARAKVRHWKARVNRYGGEINKETLERMEKRLAELVG